MQMMLEARKKAKKEKLKTGGEPEVSKSLLIHSLSIQEVHERPQHVVRVALHLVLVAGVERPFELVQQRRHLSHAVGDAALETDEKRRKDRSIDRANACEVAEINCLCNVGEVLYGCTCFQMYR